MSTQILSDRQENSFIPSSSSYLGKVEQVDIGANTFAENTEYTRVFVSLEIQKVQTEKLAWTRAFPVSSEFDSYLTLLSRDKRFSVTTVVSDVRRLFLMLSRQLSIPTLPDPQALPNEEGTLSLAWEIGEHQFTVDVFPNHKIDWFWRNSLSGEFTGQESQNLEALSPQLIEYFRNALKGE